jgi:hypothetical protein
MRMLDPLEQQPADEARPRRTFVLEDTGFKEAPKRFRRFYRHWRGAGDVLGPNEALCPVCKIVIRSVRELRAGDLVYCMPCMSRLLLVEERGVLVATPMY